MEERPPADVLHVVLPQAVLDVSQPSTDAVLLPPECRQIDGIGEVRAQQLVTLYFEPCPVRSEVDALLILARADKVGVGRAGLRGRYAPSTVVAPDRRALALRGVRAPQGEVRVCSGSLPRITGSSTRGRGRSSPVAWMGALVTVWTPGRASTARPLDARPHTTIVVPTATAPSRCRLQRR